MLNERVRLLSEGTGTRNASTQLTLSHAPGLANFCVSSSILTVGNQEGRGSGEQEMAPPQVASPSQLELLLDAAGHVVSRAEAWYEHLCTMDVA
jgi:hypothetical protein